MSFTQDKDSFDNDMPLYTDDEIKEIQNCAGILLSEWCIVRGRDPLSAKRWDFVASPRIRERLRDILAAVGFELVIVEAATRQVAFLKSDNPQLRARFLKPESVALVRMQQILFQNRAKVAMVHTGCVIEVCELLQACNACLRVPLTVNGISDVLYNLEAYNLVKINEKRKKDFSLNSSIHILPSVECLFEGETIESINERLEQYRSESHRQENIVEDDGEKQFTNIT